MFAKSYAGVSTVITSRGRSLSMSAVSRSHEFKPLTPTRTESEFSSSATINEAESRPSTSHRHQDGEIAEQQHLVEQTRRVSFATPVDLTEASLPTNHGDNLNPARDGVFARVQRIIYEAAAPAAVGVAVGVGIVEFINSTHLNSSSMKTLLHAFNTTNSVTDVINIIP